MKYYIVIGHKKGEQIQGEYGKNYDCDWIEMIERDDKYSPNDLPPGAHQLFGYLDVNFNESAQYSARATKTQEAWLIGRHRISRMLDFGNFGYQFVRAEDTKRIQFPEKITLSFDKQIKDNGVNRPYNDSQRVDLELTNLDEQIIHCFDKECTIDPIVFRLAKFDNYGDAYIDLQEVENYQDFKLHIEHFVNFMRHYPNSSIFLTCKREHEPEIKNILKGIIKTEHLTNYFEFCNADFERKYYSPYSWHSYDTKKSGTPFSEYDSFSETIDEFFNEETFNSSLNNEKNFYNVPFKKASITINENWNVYTQSEKFIKFLQYNPGITLEITGTLDPSSLIKFIRDHSIKANIVLKNDPNNKDIQEALALNRRDEIQAVIKQHGYDDLEPTVEEEENNEDYRLTLEKYVPQKLNLANVQHQNADMQVGQNQNQNQNQNQSQQLRQSNNAPYEPIKLEINNKTSIPDVNFALQDELLKRLIGLPFQSSKNAPQTETNINHLFTVIAKIIEDSPASKDCYCPLSYSIEELVPGAFYVPKEKVKSIPHPKSWLYKFDDQQSALFFSPPYASIAIKKDKYAFKPYHRPVDTSSTDISHDLVHGIHRDKFVKELIGEYQDSLQKQKITLLLNKLYAKRGQSGIDLLARSLYSVKLKNPRIYQSLINDYLLTSNDFSEYVDSTRLITTLDALAKLKDPKKIDWWLKILKVQCRNNPNFDLNHLFTQFTGFWQDIDKLQKFIPVPDQFPFDDFADAGITLGKMYRIMCKARNRFEQIKSFEGGNISHAYMLFDLFNSSIYCKEMDDYCVTLTKQLKAEDALDKSRLKETYFSTKKLAELTEDSNTSIEQLKSYLFVYAAVNGNTQKHNNSDVAFYNALFKAIDESLQDKNYSDSERKLFYSTVMLFAAYGNNSTKERMVQNIRSLASQADPIKCCQDIWNIYKDEAVSKFFSAQDSSGKMVNSKAMLSFHTVATLIQKSQDYNEIMKRSTHLIVENMSLSPALQKIMKNAPARLMCFEAKPSYLKNQNYEREQLIQSIFLITVALNQDSISSCYQEDFDQFSRTMRTLDMACLNHLNKLFLDIDFTKFPEHTRMFTGKNLSSEFLSKVSIARTLDDLIFILQEYNVQLATIKSSEQGLLQRIKQLENNLWQGDNKKHYVTNYQELIITRLHNTLGANQAVESFENQFIRIIDSSFTNQTLKASYEALNQMIETTKKENLLKIISVLVRFPIGTGHQNIDPAPLLQVTDVLLKHVSPIETVVSFLEAIQNNPPNKANAKLQYLQNILEKITEEPTCHENDKKKFNKRTINQIKACMQLMKTIDTLETTQFDRLFQLLRNKNTFMPVLTVPQYLQFIEVLASPTNIINNSVKNDFTKINSTLLDLLEEYPNSFSELLDIATFDAELLSRIPFNNQRELSLVANICRNEVMLNSRQSEQPASDYKQEFARNIRILLDKKLDLDKFYSKKQLAQPSAAVLVQLLNHYNNQVNKAFHHYEKDPWFKRPHKSKDIRGNNQVDDKEVAYQTGFFDMSKQNDVLDQITRNDSGFEKSVRRNLLFTFSTYINELGYRLPAFNHKWTKVPVRKLSDEELKTEFDQVKHEITRLRNNGQDNIWQNKKYQRAVCKLLTIIREAVAREEGKQAYSTQMDAVLLALLAGNYQYAMQINTGEGKAIIATAIAIAMQAITDKQIIVTTSNLSLADRDSEVYNKLIKWFDISHATISATTKDKSKLHAKIIHTTGNDFALCHGKDVIINNSNKIYLNDEYDYTMSHLTPAINSQSKPNEEENWWIYEEILDYVAQMEEKEAKRKPEQQVQGLIKKLLEQFSKNVHEIEKELAHKLHLIEQNADHKSPEKQTEAKEAIEKDCNSRIDFYAKRIAKLNLPETEDYFNTLIDSAIIAQFVLKKGEAYEVIDQFEEGKTLKKVVPTEGGKPITEGDVLYMYGIHQFLIQKTIMEYKEAGDNSEFIKPSELESTTYFNNYSTQAGSKSIGVTGTVPKEKYKMYEALIGGGKSDVIPPHQDSLRIDAVPYEQFKDIRTGNEHVCGTEEQLINRLVQQIKEHDGPALVYCTNKNVCEIRRDALIEKLKSYGYTVQMIIPGVTEDFTDGDKLTTLGRQAQNPKTVTITVGDGRGIDITPKGKDGLLTVCSFVPENVEKVLQIYGRSGRNGKPGKTNLYILQSELTKYGIKFDNLDEEFKFLDKIRHKEFDFAIKKIGFMQYEIQKQIRDEQMKPEIIAYMDDLYNRLVLKAVAEKVKNKEVNRIDRYTITGRWEPFVMLNDEELENIYQEFCISVKDKLIGMQQYHINIESIKNLPNQYHQQVNEAVQQEKEAQKGQDRDSVRRKLEQHTEKLDNKLWHVQNTATLRDGIEVDLFDIKSTYDEFALNLGRYDKTIDMMQKYIGTHIGIYGFINENTVVPYEQIYEILDQQKQLIRHYQQKETDGFYEYLVYKESLEAINLLHGDISSHSKRNNEAIEECLQKVVRYASMCRTAPTIGYNTVEQIRDQVLNHYNGGYSLSSWEINRLQERLTQDVQQAREQIENKGETIISRCQNIYQELQDKIYTQGARAIGELSSKPIKEHDQKLAVLFSMLQMVTKEERNSEPVQKIVKEISRTVSPLVDEYNGQVKKYKEIIKKQRVCLESLKQKGNTRDKINKYEEMVNFDDIASKNLVAFYHDYNNSPDTLRSLNEDILSEQLYLDQLEAEIERRKLEAEAERRRLAEEQRQQEERNRRSQHIEAVRNKISGALDLLRGRINEIEHPLTEAITVANNLLGNLEEEQNTYLMNLRRTLDNLDLKITDFQNAPVVKEINRAYVEACDGLINDADTRQVLERDLGWGAFLNNLLKTIVNIIITVASFGSVNNFFTLEKSETIETIDGAKNNLKP